ncbi:hypothetical protein C8R47DRAFT_1084088 [Mycena vitilis]|nr:hypothetical protein C8R47DRAFT_1084088 [Mycena vitilis]
MSDALCWLTSYKGSAQAVRLKCPDRANPAVRNLYRRQVESARAIVDADKPSVVIFPPRIASALVIGTNLEVIAGLRRIDTQDTLSGEDVHLYSMTVCEFWEMPLSDLNQERSNDVPLKADEVEPTASRRGYLRQYVVSAFGEVAAVHELDDKNGIVLKVQCPATASCSTTRLFDLQMATLRAVIDEDTRELVTHSCPIRFGAERYQGDAIEHSWFASPESDDLGHISDGCFYVPPSTLLIYAMASDDDDHHFMLEAMKPGQLVDIWTSFQRVDIQTADGSQDRSYSLLSRSISRLESTDIAVKGDNYSCDQRGNRCERPFPMSHFFATNFLPFTVMRVLHTLGSLLASGPSWPAVGGVYKEDFVANRLSSTPDQAGSIFVYKPTGKDDQTFAGKDKRHVIGSFQMTFAGTIVNVYRDDEFEGHTVYHLTLGLPDDPNDAAIKLMANQERSLLGISVIDAMEVDGPCVVRWGHPASEYSAVTVVVACKLGMYGVQLGDDIVVQARLKRIDSQKDGTLELSASMTSLLNSMGPELRTKRYGFDFAASRFSSTEDATGAVYVYRPIGEPEFFFRGNGQRPGICMQPLVFSGCVVDVEVVSADLEVEACYIVLDLAPNPSKIALSLDIAQKEFLKCVAKQDELSAVRLQS